MTTTALVGSTGLVGSQILATLLHQPSISSINSLSRRAPSSTEPKLHPLISTDSSSWASSLKAITPIPSIFFSALGTTKAAAGSIAAQRAIDVDLNLSLAQTAAEAGSKVYVLVSSSGANSASMIPYSKMKGELEDAVKELGFETVVILRPGMLLGDRDHSRLAEGVVRGFAGLLQKVAGNVATDFWAQSGEVVGRAAVSAGLQALGGGKGKVWELGQSEIVKLGRTEWKE